MGRPRRHWCRYCGGHVDEVGVLSARGRCRDCGKTRMLDNYDAMQTMSGPYFYHWRSRLLAAFGVAPLDDQSADD